MKCSSWIDKDEPPLAFHLDELVRSESDALLGGGGGGAGKAAHNLLMITGKLRLPIFEPQHEAGRL